MYMLLEDALIIIYILQIYITLIIAYVMHLAPAKKVKGKGKATVVDDSAASVSGISKNLIKMDMFQWPFLPRF